MKKIIKKIAIKYANLKLTQKFLLLLAAWIIPVSFLSIYIYQNITEKLVESQLVLAKQNYQQVESFLNYRFERMMLTSNIIALDSNLNDILIKNPGSYALNEQTKDLASIRSFLNQFQSSSNHDTLRLYVPGEFSYSNEGKLVFSLDDAENTLWYQNTFQGWGWLTLNPPQLITDSNSIAVVKPIRDLEHYTNMVGAIRIDIQFDEIEKMLSRINITQGCLSYLVTTDGIFSGASSYNVFDYLILDSDDIERVLQSKDSFIRFEIGNEKVWSHARVIDNTELILVSVIPEKEILSQINSIQSYYIIALIALLLMIIMLMIPTINSITGRIKQLVQKMKLVEEGNLSANLTPRYHDEIGLLMDDFNFMLEKIVELMKQQYLMGQELKSAELKALQSQINPHFLYNTLEMIGWLAQKGTPEEIKLLVNKLARFYRLSLNHGNDITTIENELKLVESYMYIQCMRFRNEIKLEVNIKGLEKYSIPKITLQPIVENAIIHGILEKNDKSGTIKITGKLTEKDIIELTVEDDGIGIPKKEIKKILSGQYSFSDGSNYGISNIEKRICLFFNISKSLEMKSSEGHGTKVTLRIPPVPYLE